MKKQATQMEPQEGIEKSLKGWVVNATVDGVIRYVGCFDELKAAQIALELARLGVVAPSLRKKIDEGNEPRS
jgi:hypothetical protein